jgi:hypothetical protein
MTATTICLSLYEVVSVTNKTSFKCSFKNDELFQLGEVLSSPNHGDTEWNVAAKGWGQDWRTLY